MRAILQRVTRASVQVEGEVVGAIDHGLLVLLGIEKRDGPGDVPTMAAKIAGLRIFADEKGRMNLDVASVGGGILLVSQFTLAASLARGRRPSFDTAAPPDLAEPLVEAVRDQLESLGLQVATGRFGAGMKVELVNDGPVTFVLDVRDGKAL